MLWTVMDENKVMEHSAEIEAPREYIYRHKLILGYPLPRGKVMISALISSEPKDFLNPDFFPGRII